MAKSEATGSRGASSDRLTAEERAAIKDRARELKAQARADRSRADGEAEVRAKLAEMPAPERAIAERIHALVAEHAPTLVPRTWYGMPAYATPEGKVVCFFTPASKFSERYSSFGFNAEAHLDEGTMWPTAWAVTKLSAGDEKTIAKLLKKAVG